MLLPYPEVYCLLPPVRTVEGFWSIMLSSKTDYTGEIQTVGSTVMVVQDFTEAYTRNGEEFSYFLVIVPMPCSSGKCFDKCWGQTAIVNGWGSLQEQKPSGPQWCNFGSPRTSQAFYGHPVVFQESTCPWSLLEIAGFAGWMHHGRSQV